MTIRNAAVEFIRLGGGAYRAVTCAISPSLCLCLIRGGWNRCSGVLSEAVSLSIALWASVYYGRYMNIRLIEP